jgi:hypothetical protein
MFSRGLPPETPACNEEVERRKTQFDDDDDDVVVVKTQCACSCACTISNLSEEVEMLPCVVSEFHQFDHF